MEGVDLGIKILDIASHVSDGQFVFVENLDTGTTNWSKEAVEYFGLQNHDLTGEAEAFELLVHPEDRINYKKEWNNVKELKNESFLFSYRVKNAKGEYVFCTEKGKLLLKDDETPMALIGVISILQTDTILDEITDLPNIQSFLKDISMVKSRKKECLTMAIKINRFHNINTLYGYDFGNQILGEAARYIRGILGMGGRVYRLKGTTYGIVFEQDELEYAEEVFEKIRDGLAKCTLDDCVVNIEISAGALYTRNYEVDAQSIYFCLLSALEKSKDEASYRLVLFDDGSQEMNFKMLEFLDAIKAAILNDCEGFYLCYQPFVSTATGKVIGAEALVRWRSPIFGEVSPGRFVPHLESHPCFYDLSIWVLRQALKDTKDIVEKLPDFFINVNMSYSQLERPEFKEEVIGILNELHYPKTNLQLELTERCRDLDMNYLREQLAYFRSYGIKIALDDYGTGNSTINLLCELPITCVKIDQTFILHILDKSNNQVVVDSTVQCAKRLGLNVCFEGVENEEIKEFVGKYSANYHQGYYYSRPVEMDKFKTFLEDTWAVGEVNLIRGNPKDNFGADSILSMIPGGFFIYVDDDSQKLLSVNETMLDIFECSTLDEFLEHTGGSFHGIVYEEDYPSIHRDVYQQIQDSAANMDFVTYRILTKKGKIKYVRDYGHLMYNDNDANLYYVFIVEERRESEEAAG